MEPTQGIVVISKMWHHTSIIYDVLPSVRQYVSTCNSDSLEIEKTVKIETLTEEECSAANELITFSTKGPLSFVFRIGDPDMMWSSAIQFDVGDGIMTKAKFVSAFNQQCMDNFIFCSMELYNGKLIFCSSYPWNLHVFDNSAGEMRYFGVLLPFQTAVLAWDMILTSEHIWCPPIIVENDMPILHMYAELYRKKERGYYMREETIILPKGIYSCVQDAVDTLNRCIKMRGERGGFIYTFLCHKNQKLVVCSSHKQPEPSFLRITPLCYGIGMALDTSIDIVLQTGSKFYTEPWMGGELGNPCWPKKDIMECA